MLRSDTHKKISYNLLLLLSSEPERDKKGNAIPRKEAERDRKWKKGIKLMKERKDEEMPKGEEACAKNSQLLFQPASFDSQLSYSVNSCDFSPLFKLASRSFPFS